VSRVGTPGCEHVVEPAARCLRFEGSFPVRRAAGRYWQFAADLSSVTKTVAAWEACPRYTRRPSGRSPASKAPTSASSHSVRPRKYAFGCGKSHLLTVEETHVSRAFPLEATCGHRIRAAVIVQQPNDVVKVRRGDLEHFTDLGALNGVDHPRQDAPTRSRLELQRFKLI
jgi:hypothetical protein